MQLSLQHLVYHLVELVYHLHRPVRYTPSIDQIFSADYLKYEILHGYNKLFSKSIDVLIYISLLDHFLFPFVLLVLFILLSRLSLMMSFLWMLFPLFSSVVSLLVILINFISSIFVSLYVLVCLLLKRDVCICRMFLIILRMLRSIIMVISEKSLTFTSF